MTEALLQIKHLRTYFHTSGGLVKAVDDIDLTVHKGKVLGIVGESGCGKSVTSLSVMRLVPQPNGFIDGGSITFDGVDLLALPESEMRRIRGNNISMIFQEPMTSLNPVFTIGYQIGESLELHQNLTGKRNRDRCIELIKLVGIPRAEKVVDEYPHQLSGGMRQRVMIAMALSCNPKLIIADEPTTALDVTIQAQVLELIKELKDRFDTAIMLITHDLGVIAEMADQVAVMYAGKVVEETDVISLFKEPMHPYTVGLLKSRPELISREEKLTCIRGMVPDPTDMPAGCAFAPRCDHCMDICRQEMPELWQTKPGHQVRCWLYGKEVQTHD
jgi:oligopeptide/dipeptide ABC transporter ATP-binding protein